MTDFFDLHPDAQAARLELVGLDALNAWGISVDTLRLIKYRENAVFEVNNDGKKFALRLHRVGYHSDDELRSELQWMNALQTSGVAVPDVIPTNDGELFITRTGEGTPANIQIDLFDWVDGQQLGSIEEGLVDESQVSDVFATIGEIAAKVHDQASVWELPGGFVRHAWDAEGLAGDEPFWGKFWALDSATNAERKLLFKARETIFAGLSRLAKTPETYSMIHADFVPENLMVNGKDVRLIDFDDAGFSWHMFEIATSLYFFQREQFYETAMNSLLDGYRRQRPLSTAQLEQLPLLLLARAFTYVGWVHTRQETETAREMTPFILELALETAEHYWTNHST